MPIECDLGHLDRKAEFLGTQHIRAWSSLVIPDVPGVF